MALYAAVGLVAATALSVTPAQAAQAAVRLAAPAGCTAAPGTVCTRLASRYGLNAAPLVSALPSADAGFEALDAGQAEVALVVASNPQLARADALILTDDRRMFGREQFVPVTSPSALARLGGRRRAVVRRIDDFSSLITTRVLRSWVSGLADGRIPEALAGEVVDAAYGVPAAPPSGRTVVVGYTPVARTTHLAAWGYALALRAAGVRARLKALPTRARLQQAVRSGSVTVYPDFSGGLLNSLSPAADAASPRQLALLTAALRRSGLRHLRSAPADNRRMLVMKRDVAASLGVTRISDLGRYWPAAR